MRTSILLLPLLLAACASARSESCVRLSGVEALLHENLLAQVDHDSALAKVLEDTEPLPTAAREDLIASFEAEWSRVSADLPGGAELWWFQEEKGALGRREGVVAIQGCKVLAAATLLEDN